MTIRPETETEAFRASADNVYSGPEKLGYDEVSDRTFGPVDHAPWESAVRRVLVLEVDPDVDVRVVHGDPEASGVAADGGAGLVDLDGPRGGPARTRGPHSAGLAAEVLRPSWYLVSLAVDRASQLSREAAVQAELATDAHAVAALLYRARLALAAAETVFSCETGLAVDPHGGDDVTPLPPDWSDDADSHVVRELIASAEHATGRPSGLDPDRSLLDLLDDCSATQTMRTRWVERVLAVDRQMRAAGVV